MVVELCALEIPEPSVVDDWDGEASEVGRAALEDWVDDESILDEVFAEPCRFPNVWSPETLSTQHNAASPAASARLSLIACAFLTSSGCASQSTMHLISANQPLSLLCNDLAGPTRISCSSNDVS